MSHIGNPDVGIPEVLRMRQSRPQCIILRHGKSFRLNSGIPDLGHRCLKMRILITGNLKMRILITGNLILRILITGIHMEIHSAVFIRLQKYIRL